MMKKLLFIPLLLLAFAIPAEAQFGGLLNRAKNAVENKIKDKTSKKEKKNESRSSTAQSRQSSSRDNTQQELADYYYNGDPIPAFLSDIPSGNLHKCFNSNYPKHPELAQNAVTVTYSGTQPTYTPFSDGVAYITSYQGENFFFDKQGNILFKTDMCESRRGELPRFENGVVMEVVKRRTPKCKVSIRDKKGNILKTFDGAFDATNFLNGVAAVMYVQNHPGGGATETLKYIDTKGNEIFTNLRITTDSKLSRSGDLAFISTYIRPASDGLTAVATIDKKGKRKWGFRDSSGTLVVPFQYCEVGDFSDGMAAVRLYADKECMREGNWGFIDKTGKLVIPAKYTNRPSHFDSGLAVVVDRKENTYYIDKNGATKYGPVLKWRSTEEIKDGEFSAISPFVNGHAFVRFVVHGEYDNGYTYSGVIDPSFKILGWSGLNNSTTTDMLQIIGVGNDLYFPDEDHELHLVSVPGMSRETRGLQNPYSEGLSIYISRDSGYPSGYVDRSGRIVIKVEEEQF